MTTYQQLSHRTYKPKSDPGEEKMGNGVEEAGEKPLPSRQCGRRETRLLALPARPTGWGGEGVLALFLHRLPVSAGGSPSKQEAKKARNGLQGRGTLRQSGEAARVGTLSRWDSRSCAVPPWASPPHPRPPAFHTHCPHCVCICTNTQGLPQCPSYKALAIQATLVPKVLQATGPPWLIL